MNTPRDPRWVNPANEYTVAQVARMANVHVGAVIRAILNKRLPARRTARGFWILGRDVSRYPEGSSPR